MQVLFEGVHTGGYGYESCSKDNLSMQQPMAACQGQEQGQCHVYLLTRLPLSRKGHSAEASCYQQHCRT